MEKQLKIHKKSKIKISENIKLNKQQAFLRETKKNITQSLIFTINQYQKYINEKKYKAFEIILKKKFIHVKERDLKKIKLIEIFKCK